MGDSRDGGGRPSIRLVLNGSSVRGCGHRFRSLVSGWEVVPPGFPWIRQGGLNHCDSTMREGAELSPPNSASRGRHDAEVRATRNGCVKPPHQGAAQLAQHFNHFTGKTLHQSWEGASKQGMY